MKGTIMKFNIMKRKNMIKSFIFLLILGIILNILSSILSKDKSGDMPITFEEKNSIDFIAIGDSECRNSISPMEIWSQYGYVGYNCGVSGQRLQDTYYTLKNTLEMQSPKVILLETNAIYRKYAFPQEMGMCVDSAAKEYVPILKNHNKWKSWCKEKNTTKVDFLKGYRYNTKIKPYTKGNYIKYTKQTAEINLIQSLYLKKIVKLCKSKNIKLILYSSASPVCWSYARHNSISIFAEKNKLPYVDLNLLNEELAIDWKNDTYDRGDHVNYFGAKKISKYMGKYLSLNTNLQDHRNDHAYSSWNESMEMYRKVTYDVCGTPSLAISEGFLFK